MKMKSSIRLFFDVMVGPKWGAANLCSDTIGIPPQETSHTCLALSLYALSDPKLTPMQIAAATNRQANKTSGRPLDLPRIGTTYCVLSTTSLTFCLSERLAAGVLV